MVPQYRLGHGDRSQIQRPLLEIRSISKGFHERPVIRNLSLTMDAGEIIGVFGERGSGKTALIQLLSGRIEGCAGRILLRSEDITSSGPAYREQLGIVPSAPTSSLFHDMTVLENVLLKGGVEQRAFYPRQGGAPYADEATDLLEFAGLADIANQRVDTLSCAQRCILTIAITLATNPSLLLIDNPAVGSKSGRTQIATLLMRIADRGISILITSRFFYPIVEICDRIAVLHGGGIVAKSAPPRKVGGTSAISSYLACP